MRLINLSTEKYPYTIAEIKRDHPNVSLPKNPTIADLYFANVAEVTLAPQPKYDPVTHTLIQEPPKLIKGMWVINWTKVKVVRSINSRWDDFFLYLLTDAGKIQCDINLLKINPALIGEFSAAYKKATNDHDASGHFATVFNLYCSTANVSQEHKKKWQEQAVECNLPAFFISILKGQN